MSKYSVEVFYSDEDNAFIARVPELPGCSAVGDTRVKAVTDIEDAIKAWRAAAWRAGKAVPAPSFKWNSR
jgi:predicted RNase H-like HicB family nuclease